jgi:hypothetical protein
MKSETKNKEKKMVKKKGEGARIAAKVDGVERSRIPLKAVIYTEEREDIKILAETDIKKDEFELELGISAEELPETAKLSVVPKEIKARSLIRRLSEVGYAPSTTIRRDLVLSREGVVSAVDLPLRPLDDVVLNPFKRRVCGRVIKRDPVTGEVCYVPGATVRVMDVDVHLFWWYPYPGYPWGWLYPYYPYRREEIATTTTDECGRFCVDIPYLDIDAILRWRLRFYCLPIILPPPRVIDAIDLGVKPDLRVYPELDDLPELYPKPPRPRPWPDPGPIIPEITQWETTGNRAFAAEPLGASGASLQAARISEKMSKFYTQPQFEAVRQVLSTKQVMFEPTETADLQLLERPAFPNSIIPPALPDDETMLKLIPDKKTLDVIRHTHPLIRLMLCWAEFVPEWHLFFDVPDIVFKVEQDIDGDGALETVYDQHYFDINWNLTEPTMNIELEAWSNAICVPCGPSYTPCTTTGIVGISEMPVDTAYLNNQGYAIRVNRPKPDGTRTDAETPFCQTIRLVGCAGYGSAVYYKVFYSYEGGPETHFNEPWYVYNISTGTSHHVVPDANGFYPVLASPEDYFPYHTLINWRTYHYPNGQYKVRLALYDAAYNPIGSALPPVYVVLDNSKPSPVNFLSLKWREAGSGAWSPPVPLHCPIIRRPTGKDIELEVEYNIAATHLRDLYISFNGCDGSVGDDSYWHHTVNDNNKLLKWNVTMPSTKDEGAYRFYIEGRSRAFNGVGGLATNWYYDPLHIWRGNNLHIVILDS